MVNVGGFLVVHKTPENAQLTQPDLGRARILQTHVHGLLVLVAIVVDQHFLDLPNGLTGIQSLMKQMKNISTLDMRIER